MMLVLSNGLQCRLGEGVKIRKMQTSFKCGPKAQLAWHYWQKNLASLTMQVYKESNFYWFL